MPPRQPAVSDPPPPLPGGYKVGEKVFYTGPNVTTSNGNKGVHGQQGEVVGPANGEECNPRVSMRFPGNKGNVGCLLTEVRRLRAPAATPACAHRLRPTHTTLPTPRTPQRQLLPRRPRPHCKRSRRGPLPGCGRDGGRGRGAG